MASFAEKQQGEEQLQHHEGTTTKDFWRIVCISDTHGNYDKALANIPDGDILIHAGDFSSTGHHTEVEGFRNFMESQPHPYKVFIAGNHDITIHKSFYVTPAGYDRFHGAAYKKRKIEETPEEYSERCIQFLRNGSTIYQQQQQSILSTSSVQSTNHCQYLEDESCFIPTLHNSGNTNSNENSGNNSTASFLHIYGAPWQPTFCDWAFNVDIPDIKPYWDRIPAEVDILITHGPPHGILDPNSSGFACGCPELRAQLDAKRIQPRVHVFGHIHEAYGAIEVDGTLFANASTCTYQYRPLNPPIVIDVPYDRSLPARMVSVGKNLDRRKW